MRAFITGAGGFLGSALVSRFARAMGVTASYRQNMPSAAAAGVERMLHDWANPFEADLQESQVFVHAAFLTPEKSPEAYAANERMAWNAAAAAERLGAGRVILLSTGRVYGESDSEIDETSPAIASDPNAVSAAKIERIFMERFGHAPSAGEGAGGRSLTVARLFFPYGPGQRSERLIPRLAGLISRGEPVQLRPSDGGESGRPFINPIFIDDAAELVFRLATLPGAGARASIVNLAGPEIASIRELAEGVAHILGKPCRFSIDRGAPRASDLIASTELAAHLTGYRPRTELDAGLIATLG